jgi:crotonobetainyl-CoA:carnitine CoA-transferase CaiB-like acyl-CoA transferase
MPRTISEAGRDYANLLLRALGRPPLSPGALHDTHPAVMWARSGLMSLTGRRDGAPLVMPAFLPACAEGAVAALESVSGMNLPALADPPALLGERAALQGLTRNGGWTTGGTGRFVRAIDGWVMFNLTRADDWVLVAAALTGGAPADWNVLTTASATQNVMSLVAAARDVGLAAAPFCAPRESPPPWSVRMTAGPAATPPTRRPVVVDLSSLWAGPLCGSLLAMLGGDVIKVEAAGRRDGARQGSPALFQLLNGGKRSVALDLADPHGRDRLADMLAAADIVIESARPRGLTHMGIKAEQIVAARPGQVWLSITAYGRQEPEGNWIGFGDDTAVAAGFSALLPDDAQGPVLCADAIADPLTGLHAALAAWDAWITGRGGLISVALHDVAAHCVGFRLVHGRALVERRESWNAALAQEAASPPRARSVPDSVRA